MEISSAQMGIRYVTNQKETGFDHQTLGLIILVGFTLTIAKLWFQVNHQE